MAKLEEGVMEVEKFAGDASDVLAGGKKNTWIEIVLRKEGTGRSEMLAVVAWGC